MYVAVTGRNVVLVFPILKLQAVTHVVSAILFGSADQHHFPKAEEWEYSPLYNTREPELLSGLQPQQQPSQH